MKQKLISISVTTKQWYSGNHAWFDARLKPGTTIDVLWGDGARSVHVALPTELSRVEHYYKKIDSDETYQIEFWSETPDALLELQDGLREMTLNSIDFYQCLELKKLRISHLSETDFSRCPALKDLEAYDCYCKVLDLHTAPGLRKLSCCDSGHLEKLILTGNDKLEELECQVNPRLTKVTLSNKSSLRKIKAHRTEIDDKSLDFISRILKNNNSKESNKMYRVIALGYRAGMIVERLRARNKYDDIRFVYCNTDKDFLMEWGNEDDEHILLTSKSQCREAINDDNERMAVLVTCIGNDFDCSWKYAVDIMGELWDYADHAYCFASIPYPAGGQRGEAVEIFNELTCWSDISVLQDDLKEPYNRVPHFMGKGLVCLLESVLTHYHKGRNSDFHELPFGVWATEKQLMMALTAKYSNYKKMSEYYKAGTFTFHERTQKY